MLFSLNRHTAHCSRYNNDNGIFHYIHIHIYIQQSVIYLWDPPTRNCNISTVGRLVFHIYSLDIFTLQAILFYTPRWLWKGWEGGKIHALMMDLDIGLCSEVEKKQKKKMLLDYLWENLRFHNWWAYRYYLCEVLALLNVIGE